MLYDNCALHDTDMFSIATYAIGAKDGSTHSDTPALGTKISIPAPVGSSTHRLGS